MSNLLKRLLDYALDNYYPSHSIELDGESYSSLEEKYDEWFSHVYVNGFFSVNEDAVINRSVYKVYLISKGDGYLLGLHCINFALNHTLKVTVVYDDGESIVFDCSLSNREFIVQPLPASINLDNLVSVSYSCDETVKGKVVYSRVNENTISKDDCEVLSFTDFNKDYYNLT